MAPGGFMTSSYNGISLPAGGKPITYSGGKLEVPDNPIIPYIEGDGTGRDIWAASARVFDAAVECAYGGKRKIHWFEVFAGEKAFTKFGDKCLFSSKDFEPVNLAFASV